MNLGTELGDGVQRILVELLSSRIVRDWDERGRRCYEWGGGL